MVLFQDQTIKNLDKIKKLKPEDIDYIDLDPKLPTMYTNDHKRDIDVNDLVS